MQLLSRKRIKCSPSTLIVFKLFRPPFWISGWEGLRQSHMTIVTSAFSKRSVHTFSSPEPTILLACGRNRELWAFWNNKGVHQEIIRSHAISFPEPTCLLVSTKTHRVLVLTKRHVCSGNEIGSHATELKNDCACVTCDPSRRENLDSSNKFLM